MIFISNAAILLYFKHILHRCFDLHQCSTGVVFFEHQNGERQETEAASIAVAESNGMASVAVPSLEEQPTLPGSDFHYHSTSNAESIPLPASSNDTVSSPRSPETLQESVSYDCRFSQNY